VARLIALVFVFEDAIVSAPRNRPEDDDYLEVLPVMPASVRGVLVGVALGLVGVFALARWLNPYEEDGTPRALGTHRQFGLPPCTFWEVTQKRFGVGVPCPSCGMTTSFALLIRGDLRNSLRINYAGTALALLCLLLIPWCLACAFRQRILFVRSMETTIVVIVLGFLVLMMLRWGIVLAMIRWSGTN
jgi:hypothetical protein